MSDLEGVKNSLYHSFHRHKTNKHIEVEVHLDKHPTNSPRGFHVETTWKRSFPRRLNVESTWCVCSAYLKHVSAYFKHQGRVA